MADDSLIRKACQLAWLIPQPEYSTLMSLVGIPSHVSEQKATRNQFQYQIGILNQDKGKRIFNNSEDEQEARYQDFFFVLGIRIIESTSVSHIDILKLVSIADIYTTNTDTGKNQPSGINQRLYRWRRKQIKKYHKDNVDTTSILSSIGGMPPCYISVDSPDLISPVSFDSRLDSSSRTTATTQLSSQSTATATGISMSSNDNEFVPSRFFPDHTSAPKEAPPLLLPSNANSNNNNTPSIASLTNHTDIRRTVHQAAVNRKEEEDEKNLLSTMRMVGSLLLKRVRESVANHKSLRTNDDVAQFINNAFGILGVTGRTLAEDYRKGRAGMPPPRLGRPPFIPEDEFELLCELFFTLSAIEQANGDKRLTRTELTSLLAEIINHKRLAEGLEEMDEISLMKRIEQRNSIKQEMKLSTGRESYRLLWLTYYQQLMNYIKWEEVCVKMGFARPAIDEAEVKEKGHVVFFEGQVERYVNVDECALFLDGTVEKQAGRPSSTPSAAGIAETGEAKSKSAKKVTVQFGIAGNEALPFHVIVPSSAKEGNRKLDARMFPAFKEVEGKYGLSQVYHHGCFFSCNASGGTTKETWKTYILEHLCSLYPDACEMDGRRVIIKCDSGTGRSYVECLAGMMINGFHLFPGLPNGTEAGQEMDQIYSTLKMGFYRNRDALFAKRVAIARMEGKGEQAQLTLNDIGYILRGGEIKFSDGTILVLEDAFSKYLSPVHIVAAREKCGYCPATRTALDHDLIRHQIVFSEDGTIDMNADPHGEMLDILEKENHRVIDSLLALNANYDLVVNAKRFANHVIPPTISADGSYKTTLTTPGTREHQDLLQKYGTAGVFYKIYGGGWVLTTPDMIIQHERKVYMEPRMKEQQRIKDEITNYEDVVKLAKAVYAKSYGDWLKPDFVIAIKYKQGPIIDKDKAIKTSQKLQNLIDIYEEKFKGKSRDKSIGLFKWTEKEEVELHDLIQGNIPDYRETAVYGNAIAAQVEFLTRKHNNLPFTRRLEIYRGHSSTLSESQRKRAAAAILGTEDTDTDPDLDGDDDDDDNQNTVSDDEDDVSLTEVDPNGRTEKKKKAPKKKKAKASKVVEEIGSDSEEEAEENVSSDSEDSLGLHDNDTESEEEDNDDNTSVDAVSVSDDYVGTRVCFEHSGVLFYGTVKRCFTNDQQARTWECVYDNNKDVEEILAVDLQKRQKLYKKERQYDPKINPIQQPPPLPPPSTVSDTGNRDRARASDRDRYDELVEKKKMDEEEKTFEEELALLTVTLAIANARLLNTPPDPTMDHLRALIKSKGTDPPIGRRKRQALLDIWDEVKDNDDWERNVFFENTDQVEMDELEELLA